MVSKKCAIVTGPTGQDGSYLCEFLLEKGYDVKTLIRRCTYPLSSSNLKVKSDALQIYEGDILDQPIINKMVQDCNAYDVVEIYNLAAQSHVGVSFNCPKYTFEANTLGILNILESVRQHPTPSKFRVYQASTSEMFGKVQEIPQRETTPFYPRSVYGVSKLAAHWLVKNYRESYNIHASAGILFNHETLANYIPLIFKHNGVVDIKPICEIVKYHTLNDKNKYIINENKKIYQEGEVETDLQVWDNNDWTKVKFCSAYPHDVLENNKKPKFIISKNAAYMATGEHVIIMEDDTEVCVKDIKIGDKVKLVDFPKIETTHMKNEIKNEMCDDLTCQYCDHTFVKKESIKKHEEKCKIKFEYNNKPVSEQEAEFLGVMVGDGYKSKSHLVFTSKSLEFHDYMKNLWMSICETNGVEGGFRLRENKSGFNENVIVYQSYFSGFPLFSHKYEMYNEDKTKRIPVQILNSGIEIQKKFLEGYNKADGLKSNKCIYEFKNFKTNSATLAQGLLFVLNNVTGQRYNINVEKVFAHNATRLYYSINILSNTNFALTESEEKYRIVAEEMKKGTPIRQISNNHNISRKFVQSVFRGLYTHDKKHHFEKENNEVKKIIEMDDYDGWFYDLETESGKFQAGIGVGRVHNSPRRGIDFVTKKIVEGIKQVLKGELEFIELGNLDAKRDWGHAQDYIRAMWLMLQQETPDDYVVATGTTYSVRQFVEMCLSYMGKSIEWSGEGDNEFGTVDGKVIVKVSPKFYRPCEVDLLVGDASKVRSIGWTPEHDIHSLIKDMIDN